MVSFIDEGRQAHRVEPICWQLPIAPVDPPRAEDGYSGR